MARRNPTQKILAAFAELSSEERPNMVAELFTALPGADEQTYALALLRGYQRGTQGTPLVDMPGPRQAKREPKAPRAKKAAAGAVIQETINAK